MNESKFDKWEEIKEYLEYAEYDDNAETAISYLRWMFKEMDGMRALIYSASVELNAAMTHGVPTAIGTADPENNMKEAKECLSFLE